MWNSDDEAEASGWSNYDTKNFVSYEPLTRCLKLKNLKLVGNGNYYETPMDIAMASVADRIRSNNFFTYGIHHDYNRTGKTDVYICCVNASEAAEIYKLFFEQKYNGETVKLKFIKFEKYLEKFPGDFVYLGYLK